MQMREKVGKSRNTVFFQWFVAPEGRKVGSLKRRVRSQLARWEMKNCTPLWREAHCGAKHISKSKCAKHTRCGPLLAVEMSKKCTPLWREAHFEVNMYKTPHVRGTIGVQNTTCSRHYWMFSFASLHYNTLHYTTLHYTPLRYITLRYTPLHYNYNYTTTLHYTPLHKITLHYTTVHYTTLHCTTFHYTSLHYTTLHSTTLQLQLQLQLHSTTLHYTPLH